MIKEIETTKPREKFVRDAYILRERKPTRTVLSTIVALYRTVQDCWTLDLAGHGRNPSLQDLELHENHETVAT